jgi:hypothetical protein
VAPSYRTTAGSEEINVKPHQILAHRTPRMPRCIPTPEQEVQDPRAHDRYLTPPLSYTLDLRGFVGSLA